MELDFSEEQIMLQDTVARLCQDHNDSAAIRRLERDERGYSEPFWQAMSGMGLCGLLVSEQHGGIGLGKLECAIAHEVMGRYLAPSPHFVSSVLAATLIHLAGSDRQKARWLPAISAGEGILVPAWQETGVSCNVSSVKAQVRLDGDAWLLQGEKVLVPFANHADAFIVPARGEAGLMGFIVPADQASLRPQPNHADQNLFAVNFEQLRLPPETLLGSAELAAHWDHAMLVGQIALAAQAIGGATRSVEMATAYAGEREQFGQPIGAFQAIAHYLADRTTEIEGARYLVYQAAWACDQGHAFEKLALMAKLQATAVFRRATVSSVQIHGGMGFSSEADPQLYYRRAKHLQLMHWDPRYLEQRIAMQVFA